ncbi:TRAP transporter small permease [Aestuariibius insulae]|uniref:TRAP transporter small permease n=1 Tax=Aestuariibius insulae TaxID=2058287 RepID=UPI00345E0F0F
MRRILDGVYRGAGFVAGAMILGICLLISAQILLNLSARIFGPVLPSTIPSYADFAGFMLAAATFLAMPHTLREGAHVRVTLVTDRFGPGVRRWLGVAVLVLVAVAGGYASFYAGSLIEESLRYGDTSTGIVAVPLWIVQVPLVLGLGLFTVAALDSAIELVRRPAEPRSCKAWKI